MKPLKALSIILSLAALMLIVPFFAGSSMTVFYLPLNLFILWILYLSVIPVIWYLVKKAKFD